MHIPVPKLGIKAGLDSGLTSSCKKTASIFEEQYHRWRMRDSMPKFTKFRRVWGVNILHNQSHP